MRARVASYAAVLVTLSLVGSACGGSDDESGGAGGAEVPTSTPTAASPTGSPTPVLPADPVQFRLVTEVDPAEPGLDCSADPAPSVETPPGRPVTACDRVGLTYRLEPAAIVGGVQSASADLPVGSDWAVMIELDDTAAAEFADLTAEIAGTGQQVAIVHGGVVVSAPSVQGEITGGALQISGNFDQGDAEALAAALLAGG